METTRQRIVNCIDEQQLVTTADISHRLNLTSADVRHHLQLLIRQGSVVVSGYRVSGRRGRPAQLYSLLMPSSRNNLDLLSHILLNNLSTQHSPNELEDQLRQIAIQLSNNSTDPNTNPTHRIFSTIRTLNLLNYDASWEAHVSSPCIILSHCPFIRIIDRHPEICRIDRYLLERLLGLEVTLVEKLIPSYRGIKRCKFNFH